MIEIDKVTFNYVDEKKTVIDNFSLKIERGEYIAILGANGSGKSTLAKLISGIIKPVSGSITIDSRNDFPVGIVFQNPSNQIIRSLVHEDISFGLENLGVDEEKKSSNIEEALKSLDIIHLRNLDVKHLSGGEKQRVAIAGVLAMEPDILIFDEATSMLDPLGREALVILMKYLNDKGITVINITHHLDEVEEADRVILLKRGVKVLVEEPNNLYKRESLLKECRLGFPLSLKIANILEKKGYVIKNPWKVEEVLKRYDKDIRP